MKIEENIKDFGEVIFKKDENHPGIYMLNIIGEIEGHDVLSSSTKSTKYEHIMPKLAAIDLNEDIDGLLILLNTVGGDVEAGLAIAELIASLNKPKVALVLGGSHSIGVPIAVSADYTYIVPTGTMVVHPVRLNGTVIGAKQTFDYFKQIQDRIVSFITSHASISEERLTKLMTETQLLSKDIGTILVGKQAVEEGIVNETGGIHDAFLKLISLMKNNDNSKE